MNYKRLFRIVVLVLVTAVFSMYLIRPSRTISRTADAEIKTEILTPLDDSRYEVLTLASTTRWQNMFPVTVPVKIGGVVVEASVATTLSDRAKGLSGTPYLPSVVVKLFIFDQEGRHTFWMKEMNYPIDILWVDRSGVIAHMEREVLPSSYPEILVPPVPALYVIETVAGFADSNNIEVGTVVELPPPTTLPVLGL